MTTKRKASKSSKSSRKSQKAFQRSTQAAMSIATNADKSVKQRVAAMAEAPAAVFDSDESLQSMLNVLSDVNEPLEVRLAALQSLQAASFSVIAFESCRGDYLATLRKVAQDPNPELRQRALGILARQKDGFAQKKLLEGLQNPENALVPPEKALQLIGYDVHADAYPIAREIVAKPPNEAAKREALRLLAADATAAPVFEKVLRNKKEAPEIRQVSAAALQALKPDKLQAHAREILMDKDEQEEVQATSLMALTQFGNAEAVSKDAALLKRVDDLSTAKSPKVKKSARKFLGKYRR